MEHKSKDNSKLPGKININKKKDAKEFDAIKSPENVFKPLKDIPSDSQNLFKSTREQSSLDSKNMFRPAGDIDLNTGIEDSSPIQMVEKDDHEITDAKPDAEVDPSLSFKFTLKDYTSTKTDDVDIIEMFKYYWKVLKPGILQYKRKFLIAYFFGILASVSALFAPVYLQILIDDVLPLKNVSLLALNVGIMLSFILGYFLFRNTQIFFGVDAAESTLYNLRKRLVEGALSKRVSFFIKFEKGDIMTRLSNDIDSISTFFYQNIIQASVSFLLFVIFAGFIIFWNWKLGLISLIGFPLQVLFMAKAHNPISKAALKARTKLSSLNDTMLDIITGYKEIRFFQQFKKAKDRFEEPAGNYKKSNLRSLRLTDWFITSMESMGYFNTLVPFFIGGYFFCIGDPEVTVGVIIAYYSYLNYLTAVFGYLIEGVTKLTQSQPIILRLYEILQFPEEEHKALQRTDEIPNDMKIEFKNITFRYPGSKDYIMRDFNYTINPGDKVAIIGKSGTGKSTMLNMLIRFIDPQSGEILFGGKNITNFTMSSYLKHFAYASQSPHLFKLSVKDNITMGLDSIPMERIIQAAKTVKIDEIIETLPDKYDTIVGEGGKEISGGQKQRLILARALVRDPQILLLDEFTSALDKIVEDEIVENLLRIFQKQTIICVTHSKEVAEKFPIILEVGQMKQ